MPSVILIFYNSRGEPRQPESARGSALLAWRNLGLWSLSRRHARRRIRRLLHPSRSQVRHSKRVGNRVPWCTNSSPGIPGVGYRSVISRRLRNDLLGLNRRVLNSSEDVFPFEKWIIGKDLFKGRACA